MHILIAGLNRYTHPTGLCRFTVNLANSLVQFDTDQRVSLVVGAWQRKYLEENLNVDGRNVNLISVDIRNTAPSRYLWYLKGLPKVAKETDSDILHLAFPVLFVKKLMPCPVVTTIHDLYAYDQPETIGYPNVFLNRYCLSHAIASSAALPCISEYTRTRLQSRFPEVTGQKQSPVIYQTVELSSNRKAAVSPTTPPCPERFVLCVGQHRKHKNFDLVIQAFLEAKQKRRISEGTHLLIVGSPGPDTARLQGLSRGSEEWIHFLSSISDPDLALLYQRCDLFVCASSVEGFCLPVAEALLHSSRVVCADIPTLREVGRNNCTFFSLNGDPAKSLVDAMVEALHKAKSAHSVEHFSKRLCASEYSKLYRELVLALPGGPRSISCVAT